MKLDKELYRRAYELHRRTNETELKERARTAGQRPPQQAWRRYVDLWEFCAQLARQPGERQRQQRLADWERYYARIQKLEEWRRERGERT